MRHNSRKKRLIEGEDRPKSSLALYKENPFFNSNYKKPVKLTKDSSVHKQSKSFSSKSKCTPKRLKTKGKADVFDYSPITNTFDHPKKSGIRQSWLDEASPKITSCNMNRSSTPIQ
jgi:hypothetical protein